MWVLTPLVLAATVAAHGLGHLAAVRWLGIASEKAKIYLIPWWGCLLCGGRGPAGRRFVACLAGSAATYLVISSIALPLYLSGGLSKIAYYRIQETRPGFDAHGKLLPGDRMVAWNGERLFLRHPVEQQRSLQELLQDSGGRPIEIEVYRHGKSALVTVTPQYEERVEGYLIGIIFEEESAVSPGWGDAVASALYYPIEQVGLMFSGLFEVARGRTEGTIAGPVALTGMVAKSAEISLTRVMLLSLLFAVYLGVFLFLFDLAMAATSFLRRSTAH